MPRKQSATLTDVEAEVMAVLWRLQRGSVGEVVTAMQELGLDLSQEFPKPLTDDAVRAADVVITMGCGDACPIYPGRTYLDWDIEDPVGKPLHTVRAIRDDIDHRVRALLAELLPPTNL